MADCTPCRLVLFVFHDVLSSLGFIFSVLKLGSIHKSKFLAFLTLEELAELGLTSHVSEMNQSWGVTTPLAPFTRVPSSIWFPIGFHCSAPVLWDFSAERELDHSKTEVTSFSVNALQGREAVAWGKIFEQVWAINMNNKYECLLWVTCFSRCVGYSSSKATSLPSESL